MIRPIAFANALTVTATGLAAFLIALRLLTPSFFVYFFNAQFFGWGRKLATPNRRRARPGGDLPNAWSTEEPAPPILHCN